jgi:hypothetical protein
MPASAGWSVGAFPQLLELAPLPLPVEVDSEVVLDVLVVEPPSPPAVAVVSPELAAVVVVAVVLLVVSPVVAVVPVEPALLPVQNPSFWMVARKLEQVPLFALASGLAHMLARLAESELQHACSAAQPSPAEVLLLLPPPPPASALVLDEAHA